MAWQAKGGRIIRRPWATAICLAVQAAVASEALDPVSCDIDGVTVRASWAQDAADACLGARDAIDFFRANRLETAITVRIHVRDVLPPEAGRNAAGCFLDRDGMVVMRPYAQFREYGTWFNVGIDRRMYRSLAAHEVAHALAAANYTMADPGIQAKEYIAYVTMFATMDAELRGRILAANARTRPAGAGGLTALLYMFDPMRFGVASYLHYLELDDGPVYLGAVLAGIALDH